MPFARGQGNSIFTPTNFGTDCSTYSTSMTFPTIGNGYPHQVFSPTGTPVTTAARIAKGHITNSNVAIISTLTTDGGGGPYAINSSINQFGYANNLRS